MRLDFLNLKHFNFSNAFAVISNIIQTAPDSSDVAILLFFPILALLIQQIQPICDLYQHL